MSCFQLKILNAHLLISSHEWLKGFSGLLVHGHWDPDVVQSPAFWGQFVLICQSLSGMEFYSSKSRVCTVVTITNWSRNGKTMWFKNVIVSYNDQTSKYKHTDGPWFWFYPIIAHDKDKCMKFHWNLNPQKDHHIYSPIAGLELGIVNILKKRESSYNHTDTEFYQNTLFWRQWD